MFGKKYYKQPYNMSQKEFIKKVKKLKKHERSSTIKTTKMYM